MDSGFAEHVPSGTLRSVAAAALEGGGLSPPEAELPTGVVDAVEELMTGPALELLEPVAGVSPPSPPSPQEERKQRLEDMMKKIRSRYGEDALRKGSGPEAPSGNV